MLIVEDDEAKLLAENRYSVDTVATVDEARAAIEVVDDDLILLDLALPDSLLELMWLALVGDQLRRRGLRKSCPTGVVPFAPITWELQPCVVKTWIMF